MKMQVRVQTLQPGLLRFARAAEFKDDVIPSIRDALLETTGERWIVEELPTDQGDGARPTLVEQEEASKAAELARIRSAPLVEAAFAAFPDAELVDEAEAAPANRNWNKRA